MIVLKFGGTSLADAAAIRRAAVITRDALPRAPLVVVSALAGVTDALLEIAAQSAAGQWALAERGVAAVRARHLREAAELLGGDSHAEAETHAALGAMADELGEVARAVAVLGHGTPRSRDAVAALGERMSSVLVAAAFRAAGIPAAHVDARRVVITDDAFGEATPRPERIAAEARARLGPLLRAREVPVLGGFIGGTAEGITTTLGRGGSDYSASLLGVALGAAAIEIWTDVDGILTADPRVVPDARVLSEVRADEAAELSAFGAKVLHPRTVAPAVEAGVPVVVRNAARPTARGTRITADAPRRAVTAIAARPAGALLRVRAPRLRPAPRLPGDVVRVLEHHRAPVSVMTTSERAVAVVLDGAVPLGELVVELAALGDVALERHRAVVAVVGAALSDTPGALGCALRALGTTPVHLVSLGATGISLTVVLDAERLHTAVRALHAACFGTAGAA